MFVFPPHETCRDERKGVRNGTVAQKEIIISKSHTHDVWLFGKWDKGRERLSPGFEGWHNWISNFYCILFIVLFLYERDQFFIKHQSDFSQILCVLPPRRPRVQLKLKNVRNGLELEIEIRCEGGRVARESFCALSSVDWEFGLIISEVFWKNFAGCGCLKIDQTKFWS